MAVSNLFRPVLAVIAATLLALPSADAFADVMQECVQKEKNADDVSSCVVAAKQRSERELRTLSLAITQKFQTGKDKRAYRGFAVGESHLVRDRKKRCLIVKKDAQKNQPDPERAYLACQADVNFVHVMELTQRYPQ